VTDRSTFRWWVKLLRKAFPSRIPVRVELVPQSRFSKDGLHPNPTRIDGDTVFHYEGAWGAPILRAHIRIADRINANETAEALIEEWAHVWRAHLPMDEHDWHDAIFGAIRHEIRRFWDKDIECQAPHQATDG
jgi:hypothetical protein